jgi:hypothetical protein
VSTSTRSEVRLTYAPRGAARELFYRHGPEVLLSGPAGTGKSRACLERLHLLAQKYAGMRGLICRKTRASLTQTTLVTFERKVLHPLDGVVWRAQEQEFRYPNGSRLVVGGLDKPLKIMSSEYDLIYPAEATELLENDWESLTTRLRNGVMPYQQLMGDCNPDSAVHWLKLRVDAGKTAMLESRHEDNPTLWDAARGGWTEAGAAYIAKLDALTGVRYLRLRKGIWASAEGLVYDGWDRARHLIDRIPAPEGAKVDGAGVPLDWPRYLVVDFGYTNPFVAQWWAEDPDGRLYRYREIYRTQRLVEDHAREIRRLSEGEPVVRDVVCDHDAEDRATLERHLGLTTTAAPKAVSPGIQAVASRLKAAGDGKPRLFLLRDALVEADPLLVEKKLPTCSEQEVEAYVWDVANGRKKGEEPVKKDDHGMDALRYLVASRDLVGGAEVVTLPW